MELYCKKCNHKLTITSLKLASRKELNHADQKDLLRSGMYVSSIEAQYQLKYFEYIVAVDSINLNNHKDRSRFIGCCGPGNFDTHNQVCPICNYEVGVFIDDCWTSRFIGIDMTKVSKKPLW